MTLFSLNHIYFTKPFSSIRFFVILQRKEYFSWTLKIIDLTCEKFKTILINFFNVDYPFFYKLFSLFQFSCLLIYNKKNIFMNFKKEKKALLKDNIRYTIIQLWLLVKYISNSQKQKLLEQEKDKKRESDS